VKIFLLALAILAAVPPVLSSVAVRDRSERYSSEVRCAE
jgi:hypothetical protein